MLSMSRKAMILMALMLAAATAATAATAFADTPARKKLPRNAVSQQVIQTVNAGKDAALKATVRNVVIVKPVRIPG